MPGTIDVGVIMENLILTTANFNLICNELVILRMIIALVNVWDSLHQL